MTDRQDEPDGIISRIAEMHLVSTQRGQTIILEQHASSFKWLMGSLLALNSGGLVFLSNNPFNSSWPLISAAACFYFGIAFALLIAVFGQLSANASLPPLEKLAVFWVQTAEAGEFDEEEFSTLNAELQSTVKVGLRSRLVGWLSFATFTIGLATASAQKIDALQEMRASSEKSKVVSVQRVGLTNEAESKREEQPSPTRTIATKPTKP